MHSTYIQIRENIDTDPRIARIAAHLWPDSVLNVPGMSDPNRIAQGLVIDGLRRLWRLGLEHTTDGFLRSATFEWIDAQIGIERFAESVASAGWLIAHRDGVELPDFHRYNVEKKWGSRHGSGADRALRRRIRQKLCGVLHDPAISDGLAAGDFRPRAASRPMDGEFAEWRTGVTLTVKQVEFYEEDESLQAEFEKRDLPHFEFREIDDGMILVLFRRGDGSGTESGAGAAEPPPAPAVAEPGPSDEDSVALFLALTEVGVSDAVAEELITAFPAEEIRFQLEVLPHRKVKRPPAALVTAIRKKWGPPSEYHDAVTEQRRKKERERQRKRRTEKVRAEEARAKREARRIDAYLARLAPSERHALECQAKREWKLGPLSGQLLKSRVRAIVAAQIDTDRSP